jgi:hypothetical protein
MFGSRLEAPKIQQRTKVDGRLIVETGHFDLIKTELLRQHQPCCYIRRRHFPKAVKL